MYKTKLKAINKRLSEAESYDEWRSIAAEYDRSSGLDEWKERENSTLYDYVEIRKRHDGIRELIAKKDSEGLLFALNEGIHGNMGGMGKSVLFSRSLLGTKQLIIDYIDSICEALLLLADKKNKDVPLGDKVDLFQRASICFGRSALMLSGGGQLGNFHGGVLKALAEHSLIPRVISGSSAGAIYAGLAGTKSDEELLRFINDDEMIEALKAESVLFESVTKGRKRIKIKELEKILQVIPDVTFEEAFKRTGRQINISVAAEKTNQKSRLLNAITSPHVLIRSGAWASCAIPGVFPAVGLTAKNRDGEVQPYLPTRKWVDGSISSDLPSKILSRLYGANHFIVSMTNPFALPFINDPARQNELLNPLRKFGTNVVKEGSQLTYSVSKRFFKYLPQQVALVSNTVNSVIQQDYSGDINIMAESGILKPGKLLSSLTVEELKGIIHKGELATWPKIDAIRITTKIGRVLEDILEDYRKEVVKHSSL